MRILPLAAALLLLPTIATAHAFLRAAEPPVGSTVTAAPTRVAILFSEAVEPRFSTIEVTGPEGTAIDKHDMHTEPNNPLQLVVTLGSATTGTYKVAWHVTSVDTHKTEGTYTFTVAP